MPRINIEYPYSESFLISDARKPVESCCIYSLARYPMLQSGIMNCMVQGPRSEANKICKVEGVMQPVISTVDQL